ncbi:MAG: hypothetical protein AAFV72_14525 [Cyanobacteria bacterium J06635_1]
MSELASSMMLAVFGIVFYHLVQKVQPLDMSMFWLLAIAYFTAGMICVAVCLLMPSVRPTQLQIPPAALLLGLAFITIEIGYFWVYRSGWNIGIAGAVGTTAATLILLPVGAMIFGDRLASSNFLGLFLCVLGLFLTVKR